MRNTQWLNKLIWFCIISISKALVKKSNKCHSCYLWGKKKIYCSDLPIIFQRVTAAKIRRVCISIPPKSWTIKDFFQELMSHQQLPKKKQVIPQCYIQESIYNLWAESALSKLQYSTEIKSLLTLSVFAIGEGDDGGESDWDFLFRVNSLLLVYKDDMVHSGWWQQVTSQ